ncbi:MAG TPA: ABC transporter permease [Mycobacteriales bacterium]|nr:ABC transporter permease [Mycobacteriales bacterium]
MSTVKPPPDAEDLTAAPEEATALVPAAIVAQTLPDYLKALTVRLKSGESGLLPVLLGLVIITIVFQSISPHHVFLSANNLVNLFQQSAVFMMLAMAEIFVLLLGEIDLSIGYGGAVGGVIAVQLVQPATTNWPWEAAIAVALLCCALIGAIQGTLITRLRLPAFIVTLAGLLILNGLLLIILAFGPFSGYPSLAGQGANLRGIYDLMWGHVSATGGWIAMAVIVAVLAGIQLTRDEGRRRSGLVAPPRVLTIAKIVVMAGVGVAVVLICNVNRAAVGKLEGVPWAIFIVLGVMAVYTVLLQRTRFGRYMYAIGGNAEAARRAGINVSLIRTIAFALCSFTAGIAGLLYASYLGGMSNNVNGGQLVLYAVAAAVIGGVSLFGGRGKTVDGVLGGLVIGGIYNGMYLLGLSVQWEFIVTGGVLLFAVTVDALSRRRSTAGIAGAK